MIKEEKWRRGKQPGTRAQVAEMTESLLKNVSV